MRIGPGRPSLAILKASRKTPGICAVSLTHSNSSLSQEQKVLKIIDSTREELASMLQKLVQFESVNPPGNEGPIARYLGELLKASGLKFSLSRSSRTDPMYLDGSRPGRQTKSTLLWAH